MSRIRFLVAARQDLIEIFEHIAHDSPISARRWIQKLRLRARSAARAPAAGRVVPELEREDVREVFLRTYRIVYRVDRKEILFLAFVEGSQQLRVDPDADE